MKHDDWIRKLSIKLLYRPLERIGLPADKLTYLNFGLLGLTSVYFFSRGDYLIALGFAGINFMLDYIDGELARRHGGETKKGGWIDTSLDWLYYLLLIGAIAYATNQMVMGFVCIIATVFANYISSTRRLGVYGSFPFSPIAFIISGALSGYMVQAFWAITFFAVLRGILLWRDSINLFSKEQAGY